MKERKTPFTGEAPLEFQMSHPKNFEILIFAILVVCDEVLKFESAILGNQCKF